MKSECDFYLDRAAKCLDMAEHLDKQYRGDLVQIARGWVQLAQEEADWEQLPTTDGPAVHVLDPVLIEGNHA